MPKLLALVLLTAQVTIKSSNSVTLNRQGLAMTGNFRTLLSEHSKQYEKGFIVDTNVKPSSSVTRKISGNPESVLTEGVLLFQSLTSLSPFSFPIHQNRFAVHSPSLRGRKGQAYCSQSNAERKGSVQKNHCSEG